MSAPNFEGFLEASAGHAPDGCRERTVPDLRAAQRELGMGKKPKSDAQTGDKTARAVRGARGRLREGMELKGKEGKGWDGRKGRKGVE